MIPILVALANVVAMVAQARQGDWIWAAVNLVFVALLVWVAATPRRRVGW